MKAGKEEQRVKNTCTKQKSNRDSEFIPRHKNKYNPCKYTKYYNKWQKLSDGIKSKIQQYPLYEIHFKWKNTEAGSK